MTYVIEPSITLTCRGTVTTDLRHMCFYRGNNVFFPLPVLTTLLPYVYRPYQTSRAVFNGIHTNILQAGAYIMEFISEHDNVDASVYYPFIIHLPF
jgi:hypothetical protein